MTDFLDNHDIISPFQHGFRKGIFATIHLISTVHSLALVVDKQGQVYVIFLDFSKAFGRASHFSFIFKLNCLSLYSGKINFLLSVNAKAIH